MLLENYLKNAEYRKDDWIRLDLDYIRLEIYVLIRYPIIMLHVQFLIRDILDFMV